MKKSLPEFVERIIVMEGWKSALLAIMAGALSALSLAPFHISPILLVTFPVLVWLLDGAVAPAGRVGLIGKIWPAFRIGWLFGFGYFLLGFWWVGKAFLVDAEEFIYLLPVAVVALPAGLALFWGAAAVLSKLTWGAGWYRLVGLACSIALLEWVRGTVLSGLPWNNIGYGAMPIPILMQSSGVVGLYGMAFFTVLVATLFGVGLVENKRLSWLAGLLVLGHAGYGLVTLSNAKTGTVPDVKIRIVQPNVKQSEKWQPENEKQIMQRYLDISNRDAGPEGASVGAFTHVIWPESAFPFILTQRPDQLSAIAEFLPDHTSLITGAMRLEQPAGQDERPKVYNSLYLINGQGEIVEARDKLKLVPFGEFLPFQGFLESLGLRQLTQLHGGFEAGRRRKTVSNLTTPAFLPLICYEIIYSGKVDAEGKKAKWIINLTNDAWFGVSAGPYQHAHQSQVRAVEEGLPVIRSANSGISMVVDSYGRILKSLPLEQQGVVDSPLPISRANTIFKVVGNMFILVLICVLFLLLVGLNFTKRKLSKTK